MAKKTKKKVGRRGKPVKIPTDFDTAIKGFIANAKQESQKKKEDTNVR